MDIDVENLDGVLKVLADAVSNENIELAMGKVCALVERTAKKKAPKDKGDLRRSITSYVNNDGVEVKGVIYTPLEYAPYVEYGTGLYAEEGNGRKDVPWAYKDEKTGELIWTVGQHPHPYMRPALNENREQIKKLLQGGIKK